MSNAFGGCTSFNGDITTWDVSQVSDMSNLFKGATSFNQDLSGWNVSQVVRLEEVLDGASSFNQDICMWEASLPSQANYNDDLFATCPDQESDNLADKPIFVVLIVMAGMLFVCMLRQGGKKVVHRRNKAKATEATSSSSLPDAARMDQNGHVDTHDMNNNNDKATLGSDLEMTDSTSSTPPADPLSVTEGEMA